jgi:hypothetical protein
MTPERFALLIEDRLERIARDIEYVEAQVARMGFCSVAADQVLRELETERTEVLATRDRAQVAA